MIVLGACEAHSGVPDSARTKAFHAIDGISNGQDKSNGNATDNQALPRVQYGSGGRGPLLYGHFSQLEDRPDFLLPRRWPSGKAGNVLLVEFTISGQPYQAFNGGPHQEFNDKISLSVQCEDQDEIDRYWNALTADGGKPVQCGWLKDKYGVSWQIVPKEVAAILVDEDREKSRRVLEAVLQMVKLDIAALRDAYAGKSAA